MKRLTEEAENAKAAFADVRSNYCVVNDPDGHISHKSPHFQVADFEIGEEPVELEDDESFIEG